METLKKIVTNQYFPAAAVLTAVILFWAVGLLGGLSLLHNNQPPLTTLTWMLFVYGAAVLTPLAGLLAAADLLRRWRLHRAAGPQAADTGADTGTDDAGTLQGAGVPYQQAESADAAEPRPESSVPQPDNPATARDRPSAQEPAAQAPAPKKQAARKSGAKKAA
jgi:hypothetical protein